MNRFVLMLVTPAEGQDLLDQVLGPVAGFLDLLEELGIGCAIIHAVEHDFGVAQDGRQDVVEVVRDAPGQGAEGLHLLGLLKLAFTALQGLFGLHARGDVLHLQEIAALGVFFVQAEVEHQDIQVTHFATARHKEVVGACRVEVDFHFELGRIALLHHALHACGNEGVVEGVKTGELLGVGYTEHLEAGVVDMGQLALAVIECDADRRMREELFKAPFTLLERTFSLLARSYIVRRADDHRFAVEGKGVRVDLNRDLAAVMRQERTGVFGMALGLNALNQLAGGAHRESGVTIHDLVIRQRDQFGAGVAGEGCVGVGGLNVARREREKLVTRVAQRFAGHHVDFREGPRQALIRNAEHEDHVSGVGEEDAVELIFERQAGLGQDACFVFVFQLAALITEP